MKKTLKIILGYFIFLIAGVIAGTLLYSLFVSVLNGVIGKKAISFELGDLRKSFFYVAFAICLVICTFMILVRIKHKGGVTQLIAFILLSGATWMGLLPVVLHFGQTYSFSRQYSFSEKGLSGGYFRQSSDKIYYFSEDYGDSFIGLDVPTVVIDTQAENAVSVTEDDGYIESQLFVNAYPYRDLLIKQNFEGNNLRLSDVFGFRFFLIRAQSAWEEGITFWLGFASMGFVLCALYGLTAFFGWKLVNTTFNIFASLAIFAFNTAYQLPLFDGFKSGKIALKITSLFSDYVFDPPLVIINILSGLIFIVIGIIHFAVMKKKESRK